MTWLHLTHTRLVLVLALGQVGQEFDVIKSKTQHRLCSLVIKREIIQFQTDRFFLKE